MMISLSLASDCSFARTSSVRKQSSSPRNAIKVLNQQRTLTIRASYDVDVEAERRSAPNAPPGRNWGQPPPPPPPPPPSKPPGAVSPSRRDFLIGFLGLGVGVGGTAAYYNTTYDLSEDSYEKALDALLDNPDFLNTAADEALFQAYEKSLVNTGEDLDSLRELDAELKKLKRDLEQIAKEE